jgi:hypothetical protein
MMRLMRSRLPLLSTCCRHDPGAATGRAASLVHPSRISLPRKSRRVGLRIVLFEASAFTHVMACTLAQSPSRDPLSRDGRRYRIAPQLAQTATIRIDVPGDWAHPDRSGAPTAADDPGDRVSQPWDDRAGCGVAGRLAGAYLRAGGAMSQPRRSAPCARVSSLLCL